VARTPPNIVPSIVPSPMPALPLRRCVEEFTDRLVAVDLPALPAERRQQVCAYAGRRFAALPSPLRAGVSVLALVVDAAGRLVGRARLARFLARHPLPVVGDYVRFVRSLTFAYVWGTWPRTATDGAAVSDRQRLET
jgi:hypothetical protein